MNWKLFVLASSIYIVFENLQKKGHSTLRAKRAALTYWVYKKSSWKIPKIFYFSVVLKTRYCCQTVLPDRSTLKRPKLVESAKIEKGQIRHFEIIFKHCGVVQANGFQVLFLQISSKSLNPLSGGGGGSSTSWCSSWLPCYHDKRSLSILFFYALKVPPPHTPLQKIWWKP